MGRERTESRAAGGPQNKQNTAPRPRAPGVGNQREPETTGAPNGRKKRSKAPSGGNNSETQKGGGGNRQRAANGQATPNKREHKESREVQGQQNKQHTAPRPTAPGAGNQRKQETKRAQETQRRRNKKKKQRRRGGQKKDQNGGNPSPEGAKQSRKTRRQKEKVRRTKNAPGRPARPTRPRRASTRTHVRDPGVASSDPQGEVSASTRNSSGAPAESPVERRTVRETGRVSDPIHTRQPPQRTQPKTDAGGTRQGQPHRGAPNRYDAERAQRPCLGGGQRQAH